MHRSAISKYIDSAELALNLITSGSTNELERPCGTLNNAPTGYANACTPAHGALVKAIPAKVEPSNMLSLALILFGSLLRHHYLGGERFQSLQNIAVIIAEVPMHARNMIKYRTLSLNKQLKLDKHKDKKRFEQFIEKKRNALLVLPRYDHSLSRSVVDIIDLNNFEVIHTYKHDINEMNNQVRNIDKFPNLKVDNSQIRFQYFHPLLLEDGSLISSSTKSLLFKIDFCSNLKWINEEMFHHSKMLDHEGNILIPANLYPKSKYIKNQKIIDDAIFKMNTEGEILYKKSIIEMLIEKDLPNKTTLGSYILRGYDDPIHLNDIEPALTNTLYWKIGDVFLSSPKLNAIIHYRPKTNKVLNYITGPFSVQHDVDIISEKEISIFNNNELGDDTRHSEILIYNFEKKTFRKKFNNQLQKENFKTSNNGLSHTLNDGSLLVEEQNHGRLILFNNKGEKEWEYVNKDKNGDIGFISWSRVIENDTMIKKIKTIIKDKEC